MIISARRSIWALPAEGRPGPSEDNDDDIDDDDIDDDDDEDNDDENSAHLPN